jgi:hypothetical protein
MGTFEGAKIGIFQQPIGDWYTAYNIISMAKRDIDRPTNCPRISKKKYIFQIV